MEGRVSRRFLNDLVDMLGKEIWAAASNEPPQDSTVRDFALRARQQDGIDHEVALLQVHQVET